MNFSVVRRSAPRIVEPRPSNSRHTGNGEGFEGYLRNYLKTYFARFGDELPPPGLYERLLVEFERPLVAAALAATNGNQVRAADLLGLNRKPCARRSANSASA